MDDILKDIGSMLKAWGLKGSGQNYRKIGDQSVMVVNFQISTNPDRFYVNLGVQPLFIEDESGKLPDSKKLKEHDCIFRKRIPPPEGMLGWPRQLDAPSLDRLKQALTGAFQDYLTPLARIPGLITDLTPDQFMALDDNSILGGKGARMCLHFARIALARNDRPKARAFAQLGLDLCGPVAASLRGTLKQLIQKTVPPAVANA
jgi:hypothetical protein